MRGAHVATRNRLHPHRKERDGVVSRIAAHAPAIGRALSVGMTAALVMTSPSSSAPSSHDNRPAIEFLTPGQASRFTPKLGTLARKQAMRQSLDGIKQYALGRAIRVIQDIGVDTAPQTQYKNAIATKPNPNSDDPIQSVAYYPGKDGGFIDVDSSVREPSVSDPRHTSIVQVDQEFSTSGAADAWIRGAERRHPLHLTDFLQTLGMPGVSLDLETVSVPPTNTSSKTIVFSGGTVRIQGITDGGTLVTPMNAQTLLLPFNGDVLAQTQYQQQAFNAHMASSEPASAQIV